MFEKYIIKTDFTLGSTDLPLKKGEIVEYDGAVLKRGEKTYEEPRWAAAVKANWAQLLADKDTAEYVPQPAKIQIKEADTTKIPTEIKDTCKFNPGAEATSRSSEVKDTCKWDPNGEISRQKEVAAGLFKTPTNVQTTPANIESAISGFKKFAGAVEAEKVETLLQMEEDVRPKQTTQMGEAAEPQKPLKPFTTGAVAADTAEELLGMTGEAEVQKTASKIEWDKSIHWKTRVNKALEYKDSPETLKYILSIEDPAVVNGVKQKM